MNTIGAIVRARLLITHGGLLGSVLDGLAHVFGDRPLVEEPSGLKLAGGKTTLTYREAAALVARASRLLRTRCAGRKPIVIHGPNGYDFFLACLAVARAGGVVVPINPQMRPEEIDYVVRDADGEILELDQLEAELATIPAGDQATIRPAFPRADDVAAILYTSGTTGKPKGAMLSHRAMLEQPSRMLLVPRLLELGPLVSALPVAHIMGFEVLLAAAFAGVQVFSLPRFRPTDVLDAIEQRQASVFVGVPAMYRMMLEAGAETRNLKSVQIWFSAADVMSEEVAQKFKRLGSTLNMPWLNRPFGEATFVDCYGMVELAGAAVARVSPPVVTAGLEDALGFPLPPFRLQVVDEQGREVPMGEVGELTLSGPGILKGYHRNEEATRAIRTEEGWIKTGDLARRSHFGLIHFVGRKKDVIKHGGYSVFPAEIEETLREHPAISDAAVVGQPDPVKGEVPVAFVELSDGASIDEADLVHWAAERLAEYKTPKLILFIDHLPRTGTKKVAKNLLREKLNSRGSATGSPAAGSPDLP